MIWHKIGPMLLESIPPRYTIRVYIHGYYKSYEAMDTLIGGVLAMRRGVHMRLKNASVESLESIKAEVEEYDAKFG